MADRLIEMRAVADMPGTSMRIASEDLRVIVARIDAQAAEIERLQDLLETAVRQNNAGKLMTQSHIADCCSILKGMK